MAISSFEKYAAIIDAFLMRTLKVQDIFSNNFCEIISR